MISSAKTITLLFAAMVAAVCSGKSHAATPASTSVPTTRPARLPFLNEPLKPTPEVDAQPSRPVRRLSLPRADLRLRNRDLEANLMPAASRKTLDLPPLADTSNVAPPPPVVLPEKPRHKLEPLPERPFVLPATIGRPRWSTLLPAPGIKGPTVFDGIFQPLGPMVREYIPETAPAAIPPQVNLGTRAEFDGVNDDDVPAVRADLPSRPNLSK